MKTPNFWQATASLALVCVFLNITLTQAQQSKEWKFLVEPYVMFPNMNGRTAVRQLPAVDVDADAGDIFSKLQVGAMLYLEASNNKWAFSSDVLFMDLEQDIKPTLLITNGEASAKQLAWEVAGLKRLAPWLETGIAVRVVSLKSDIFLNDQNGSRSGSLTKVWFDPVLVVRSQGIVREKLLLQFRGDFGGFGIGSDFTWQIQANVGYKFSELLQVSAGYRIISIDYNTGSGSERFLYDMNTFGPVVRFGFNF